MSADALLGMWNDYGKYLRRLQRELAEYRRIKSDS